MNSVQEKYEELVGKEDTLIRGARTCEKALYLLKDEMLYKQRGETCQDTLKEVCEWIQQREEKLRREIFAVRWENDRSRLFVSLGKQTSGRKSTVTHSAFLFPKQKPFL